VFNIQEKKFNFDQYQFQKKNLKKKMKKKSCFKFFHTQKKFQTKFFKRILKDQFKAFSLSY